MPYKSDAQRKARWANVNKNRLIRYRDIHGEIHEARPSSMVLQTVLFDNDVFDRRETISWLKDHKMIHELDIKPNMYRARQVNPNLFKKKSFRHKTIEKGIAIITGKLRNNS